MECEITPDVGSPLFVRLCRSVSAYTVRHFFSHLHLKFNLGDLHQTFSVVLDFQPVWFIRNPNFQYTVNRLLHLTDKH